MAYDDAEDFDNTSIDSAFFDERVSESDIEESEENTESTPKNIKMSVSDVRRKIEDILEERNFCREFEGSDSTEFDDFDIATE